MPASPGLVFGGRGGVWGDSDLGLGLFGRPGFPLEQIPNQEKYLVGIKQPLLV